MDAVVSEVRLPQRQGGVMLEMLGISRRKLKMVILVVLSFAAMC